MKKNAVILAAGKSTRFAPFTYEKPKGLFCVKGEILIERQIEQLIEAGVEEIYIIVGYMKEKFFYLESKYPCVKLVVNNSFSINGNILSLYVVADYLKNTFICCSDHYFPQNPFLDNDPDNKSFRMCTYYKDKFNEFAVDVSDAGVITGFEVGGTDKLAMVGVGYFNESFSEKFRELLKKEINDFGVKQMFWEEFYAKHQRLLTLYVKECSNDGVFEFESIDDLRQFDAGFLKNVDSNIILNICSVLKCEPDDIVNINVINAGLTNVSFSFEHNGKTYVYRHPGGTAGNLIDRSSELFAQAAAKRLGIDDSYIHMSLDGWKVSHYVKDARNCDFEKYKEQLPVAMSFLHKIHSIVPDDSVKVFDNIAEGKKLMKIASATKGDLEKEFADIIEKAERLYGYLTTEAERLNYKRVLCHNDVYAPNYLYNDAGEIYLIDWEYAGLNYAANDICCILCRYDFTDQQIEHYLTTYVGHTLTEDEWRFYLGFIPISAFYWFCWGLYKGSVGDEDGFYFITTYRNFYRFIDRALNSFEGRNA